MHDATEPLLAADTSGRVALRFFVLGATGRTGSLFVSQCLARGHSVTAFVRDATRLPASVLSHSALQIVTGELSDVDTIARSLSSAGHDVLVCMLASESPPYTAVSTGTHSLLRALEIVAEPRRIPFFSIASWGMGPSRAYIKGLLMRTVVSTARSTFWARPYADFELQFASVDLAERKGLIRPTILLPPILTQGPKSDDYVSGEPHTVNQRMRMTSSISRASLADLCVRLAERAARETVPRWIAVVNASRAR
ncbi:NAD(P)-dependent oxidoreductase [Paraburkholderia caribensis]|uniref:NAD(P)-dependent oxidoreductase n=1 Tax=Paraburkholderia caribensis TaxID=75105 RepID=UPI001CC6F4DA